MLYMHSLTHNTLHFHTEKYRWEFRKNIYVLYKSKDLILYLIKM